jgi:hypothetical protein
MLRIKKTYKFYLLWNRGLKNPRGASTLRRHE